jgi:glycosyltransferase involved in cell wall biosynthesis
MHIGLVVYGGLDRQSGGYLYDRKLTTHLRSAGHTVTVVPQPERASYPAHVLDAFDLSFWRRLAAAPFDVLLQDELNHLSLAVGNRWLRTQVGCPIVSIVHHLRSSEPHPPPLRALYRWIEQQYLRTVDACVYNSPSTRRSVERLVAPRPHVVAPPSGRRLGAPPPAAFLDARSRAKGPLQIVFVGNVIPRKQLHVLVDAASRLDPRTWHLDIVGAPTDATYAHFVRQQIARLPEPGCVTWHGRLSNEVLRDVLRHGHVLAVPSTYEGFGIVYVEAMGQGLPVIATPHGGPVDLVQDGTTGFLVRPPLEREIAARLRQLHTDRDGLARMAHAARAQYEASPTWAETTASIHAFLDHLA